MGIRTAQLNESEREFDRIARERGDVRCVNVSPYTARFEIATAPGSAPRYIRVEPGEFTMIQHGYTVSTPGAGRHPVPPAIESLTTREAWPAGLRVIDGRENAFAHAAGPRLPMLVSADRATEVKAQWDQALAKKQAALAAPLKLTLQRNDGTRVEVDAEVVSAPAPDRADDDAMVRPIPDDDPDNMEPAVLPSAAPPPTTTPAMAAAKDAIKKGAR